MIELDLPYPPSTNELWEPGVVRGPKGRPIATMRLSSKAAAYKTTVGWLLRKAGVRKPIEGRVAIVVWLYPQAPADAELRMRKHGDAWDDTVRAIDLDNASKVLLDAMKGIAFTDDRMVWSLEMYRGEPKRHAYLRVVVRSIPYVKPQTELFTHVQEEA